MYSRRSSRACGECWRPLEAEETPGLGRCYARQRGFDLHAGVRVPPRSGRASNSPAGTRYGRPSRKRLDRLIEKPVVAEFGSPERSGRDGQDRVRREAGAAQILRLVTAIGIVISAIGNAESFGNLLTRKG